MAQFAIARHQQPHEIVESSHDSILKIPLVYHRKFNISFLGVEKILHDFDTRKFEKIYESLAKRYNHLTIDNIFAKELIPADEKHLRIIHSEEYLQLLKSDVNAISKIMQVSILSVLPASVMDKRLLLPLRYGTAGTILASELALQCGWSINLAGGYHHAKSDDGDHHCCYADIPIAVKRLFQKNLISRRVLIIDLNLTQGTGYMSLFANERNSESDKSFTFDDRIHIMDFYDHTAQPQDANYVNNYVVYNVPLEKYTSDNIYLMTLNTHLRHAILTSNPELVIYCAGTDIYEKDRIGNFCISWDGVIKRDEMVFTYCRENNINIMMVTSAGYAKDSAELITASISNLQNRGLISFRPVKIKKPLYFVEMSTEDPQVIDNTTNVVKTDSNRNLEEYFATKLPLVYHPDYNMHFLGMEKLLHSFDTNKYQKIFHALSKKFGFTLKDNCFSPDAPARLEDLLKVHTKEYLESLSRNSTIADISEVSLIKFAPRSLVEHRVMIPMQLATAGTVLASELAVQYGWSINLGGGYHHAKRHEGEGYCIYADVPLAVNHLLNKKICEKILIVDLSATQGNGITTIFSKVETIIDKKEEIRYFHDDRVHVLDIYNANIFPQDDFAKQFITYNEPINPSISDEAYLELLSSRLTFAMMNTQPDILIYQSGIDIYKNDPLGEMHLSKETIILRDEIVFTVCRERHSIPIMMVLGGGFTTDSAEIITASIENLHNKGLICLAVEKLK